MKNGIEEFVRQNRAAFDDKEPSDKVWRGIQGLLPTPVGNSWWNSVVVWRAAAIIFMALSAYLLFPKTENTKQNSDLALKEFTDVETFYFQQISEKVELIEDFRSSEGMNGFTQDFKQLEAMYMVLREEVKNNPSQKVKDALVLNLLTRIDLLNQELHKLEKNFPKEKEETNT